MRITTSVLVTAFCAIASICSAQVSRPTGDDDAKPNTISVREFRRANVIGHLEHPLGTVVRITGVCIDGDSTRRKADAGKALLEVRTVNGKELQRPFVVPFARASKDITKPKDGDAFDYYAHEWGRFDGFVTIPEAFGIEQPMVANDGFHYRPQIAIHKSNGVDDVSPLQRSRTKK